MANTRTKSQNVYAQIFSNKKSGRNESVYYRI